MKCEQRRRGSSPTVREGLNAFREVPSLTVGLLPLSNAPMPERLRNVRISVSISEIVKTLLSGNVI